MVIWPACVIEMVPAHMHWQVLSEVRAGTPPTATVADPGAHGPAMTGRHGWGVSTPSAAAVAAATWGLAGEVHMPKVGMFVIGIMSWIVATGWFEDWTRPAGRTARVPVPGRPIGQAIIAPLTTI